MSRSMDDDFTYFVKFLDDNGNRYYLKSSIDERTNTILMQITDLKVGWVGALNQQQVRALAKKFPREEHDTFYSHTQRAFSKGNHAEGEGKTYVFTCKKNDKKTLDFIWKEMVDDLNSLKIIGHAELQERPIEEILAKMMDHIIDEMEGLRSANEQKVFEIKRINGQLNKALETVKQTVDMKDRLESDLYRKFVLILNTKKDELVKLKHQIESYETDQVNRVHPREHSDDEGSRSEYQSGTDDERSNDAFANLRARSTSPVHTTASLNDMKYKTNGDNKRDRSAISDTDTSGDEDQFMDDNEVHEIQIPIHPTTQSEISIDPCQDSLLDLGDDRMDYKPSTISKHHQRRKYVTGANSISTRPYLSHAGAGIPPTLTTPSLPEESQTADDLLEKI